MFYRALVLDCTAAVRPTLASPTDQTTIIQMTFSVSLTQNSVPSLVWRIHFFSDDRQRSRQHIRTERTGVSYLYDVDGSMVSVAYGSVTVVLVHLGPLCFTPQRATRTLSVPGP